MRDWSRGPEKDSDSEQDVQVESQCRQCINKGADVVEGLLSDDNEEVEEIHVTVPVRKSVKEIDNEVIQKFRNDFEHLRNYVRYSVTIDW